MLGFDSKREYLPPRIVRGLRGVLSDLGWSLLAVMALLFIAAENVLGRRTVEDRSSDEEL